MKTLGVGILGYGFMGKTHTYAYRTLPFYYDPPPLPCQLKVVCTSRPDSAEAARIAGGFERGTTNPMELIQAPDVDIVHICTPNHLHLDALQAAIRANKHIYVEKPLVANLEQARAIEKILPDYRGTGQIVLQNRFLPAMLRPTTGRRRRPRPDHPLLRRLPPQRQRRPRPAPGLEIQRCRRRWRHPRPRAPHPRPAAVAHRAVLRRPLPEPHLGPPPSQPRPNPARWLPSMSRTPPP